MDANAAEAQALPLHLHPTDNSGNDAGLLMPLNPGVYTAQLGSNTRPGGAVVGVDVTANADAHLTNISTRAYVSGGENDAFAGFVIDGSGELRVMLRGIAVDADVEPTLLLLKHNCSDWDVVATNDEWEQDASAEDILTLPSNLQLPDDFGNDAGILTELRAGVYTLQLGSSGSPGLAVVGVDVVGE